MASIQLTRGWTRAGQCWHDKGEFMFDQWYGWRQSVPGCTRMTQVGLNFTTAWNTIQVKWHFILWSALVAMLSEAIVYTQSRLANTFRAAAQRSGIYLSFGILDKLSSVLLCTEWKALFVADHLAQRTKFVPAAEDYISAVPIYCHPYRLCILAIPPQ